jgi:hypothetical protein
MQLTPEFLPVGSIVEYNYNDSINPDWKPVILDALHMIRIFQHWNTYKHHYRPILLTEKILTEWCGASELRGKHDEFGIVFENDGVLLEFGEMLNDGRAVFYYNLPDETAFKCIANIHYIHELQLLCAGLKLPLPIQIK